MANKEYDPFCLFEVLKKKSKNFFKVKTGTKGDYIMIRFFYGNGEVALSNMGINLYDRYRQIPKNVFASYGKKYLEFQIDKINSKFEGINLKIKDFEKCLEDNDKIKSGKSKAKIRYFKKIKDNPNIIP